MRQVCAKRGLDKQQTNDEKRNFVHLRKKPPNKKWKTNEQQFKKKQGANSIEEPNAEPQQTKMVVL
jgi:hypothetical protein